MKNKKSLIEVIQKEMPEWFAEVAGLSTEAVNERLAQNSKDLSGVEKEQDDDKDLNDSRERTRQFNAPYVDAKKALKLKRQFLVSLVSDKDAI